MEVKRDRKIMHNLSLNKWMAERGLGGITKKSQKKFIKAKSYKKDGILDHDCLCFEGTLHIEQ